MAALEHSPGEDHDRDSRATFPYVALAATTGGALAFGGVGAAVWSIGGNPAGMVAGAVVLFLAAILLALPATRGAALLLTWNGLGIALGMFVIGIFSVGALMAFPLAMIALALSSWPRAHGEPVATLPALVAQVGGFALTFLLYGFKEIVDDLARLAGL